MIGTRKVALGTLLATVMPSVAFANPSSALAEYSLLALPLLFPLEGLLIAVMAKKSSVYILRFVLVWTIITLFTYFLLVLLGSATSESLASFPIAIGGEIAIIIIEACCIVFLLGRASLARNPYVAPSLRRALVYSFIANLVSFGGGTLAMSL